MRRRGLVLIVVGLGIGVAVFVALIVLSKLGVIQPRRDGIYSRIWGLPAVPVLWLTILGAIQLLTGRSFKELGAAYSTMSGARRFVVSVLVVALALAVIVTIVAIAFAIML